MRERVRVCVADARRLGAGGWMLGAGLASTITEVGHLRSVVAHLHECLTGVDGAGHRSQSLRPTREHSG